LQLRIAFLIALPVCATAGALLGARGDVDDRGVAHVEVISETPGIILSLDTSGSMEGTGDAESNGADWLLPYALQPDDLPEAFRSRLHTEAFVTSDYPGIEGEVEAVFSIVFGDDPFIGAAFQNLADPGSASASDIEPATYYVLVSVFRAEDASAARGILAEFASPAEDPQPVLLAFDGDEPD
jgi:hypothetical protein